MTFSDWESQSEDHQSVAKVELLNVQGFTAEIYYPEEGWVRAPLIGFLGISVIAYDFFDEQSDRFVVVFDGSEDEVSSQWNNVISTAGNYQYAEHPGISDRRPSPEEIEIRNFPDSLYVATGDNSNVFARYLVYSTNMRQVEVSERHPPNERWRPARDFNYDDFRNAEVAR